MPAGRPKKYTDVEVMQKKIDAYFEECDKDKRPYTVSGLAYALDMDRQSLLNYSKDKEFFGTIKKAKDKILRSVEEKLFMPGYNTAGVIFNLKNNFGWEDRQKIDADVDTTITIEVEIEDELPS